MGYSLGNVIRLIIPAYSHPGSVLTVVTPSLTLMGPGPRERHYSHRCAHTSLRRMITVVHMLLLSPAPGPMVGA